jgi:hypothetical protein
VIVYATKTVNWFVLTLTAISTDTQSKIVIGLGEERLVSSHWDLENVVGLEEQQTIPQRDNLPP